jgi:hypothetical protein
MQKHNLQLSSLGEAPMTKQAPILEASMTKTGGTAHSVIGASNLFGH